MRLPAIEAPKPVLEGRPVRRAANAQRSVVIVEDDADVSQTLRMALEMVGHSVVTAADGLTGLETIRSTEPDVAIVDIGLPRLNGYQIAQRLRSQDQRVFLIALTGYGTHNDYERAKAAGFDKHLTKPADLAALAALSSSLPAAA